MPHNHLEGFGDFLQRNHIDSLPLKITPVSYDWYIHVGTPQDYSSSTLCIGIAKSRFCFDSRYSHGIHNAVLHLANMHWAFDSDNLDDRVVQ